MTVRSAGENLGLDGFVWFFGVVEDRMDPLCAGRVRVRCYGWHTKETGKVAKEDLPWAQVMMPITSGSLGGIGQTATGVLEGTTVIGFFLDGKNATSPMILGTLPGISTEAKDGFSGFGDPTGIYPIALNVPDAPKLSNKFWEEDKVSKDKTETRVEDVSTAEVYSLSTVSQGKTKASVTWEEPVQRGDSTSVYPLNHVIKTESGHAFEIDDTAGGERIHQYHRTGTFYEIQPDGSKVTKVVGKNYEIYVKDNNVLINGDCNVTIKGDARLLVEGDYIQEVVGDYHLTVHGNRYTKIGGKDKGGGTDYTELTGSRATNIAMNETTKIDGNRNTIVGGDDDLKINGTFNESIKKTYKSSSLDERTLVTKGTSYYISTGDLNIASGANLSIASGSKFSLKSTTAAKFTFGTSLDFSVAAAAKTTYNTTLDLSVAGIAKYDYNGVFNVRYDNDYKSHFGKDTYNRHAAGVDYACSTDPVRTSDNDCTLIPTASTAESI